MPKFAIVYTGGQPPSTPEEGQQHMQKYQVWMAGLGERAVSPANPFKGTQTIAPDGSATAGSACQMSGFTIIEAEDMDQALADAKACPFLGIGGSLEVSEIMSMPF
ncbi:hypothetical protein DBZ36_10210 [Alginatibacterium sediminis]|uniref:YCII-related domain-containing protein n=1 Tax=Alginatibacterium sediminis TaxID=2164068 RepID=A0A420EDL4_9ALTE|nr:YciI family protein [Alginatibacterium sediminis]RKF18760.1 hypothetical protein DBZ36_10210 [Alginatibacterium sediminis]